MLLLRFLSPSIYLKIARVSPLFLFVELFYDEPLTLVDSSFQDFVISSWSCGRCRQRCHIARQNWRGQRKRRYPCLPAEYGPWLLAHGLVFLADHIVLILFPVCALELALIHGWLPVWAPYQSSCLLYFCCLSTAKFFSILLLGPFRTSPFCWSSWWCESIQESRLPHPVAHSPTHRVRWSPTSQRLLDALEADGPKIVRSIWYQKNQTRPTIVFVSYKHQVSPSDYQPNRSICSLWAHQTPEPLLAPLLWKSCGFWIAPSYRAFKPLFRKRLIREQTSVDYMCKILFGFWYAIY